MKKSSILTLLPALALIAAGLPSGLQAQQPQQQVRETPAVYGPVKGGNPQGYITNANEQGIFFSTQPGGRGALIPYDAIKGEGLDKAIRFDERSEALGEARALFAAGEYSAAADAFGAVARNYAIILLAPQNFASEALFYQAESLQRAGLYAKLAQLVNAPVAKTIETKLSERYQRNFEFHKLWALLGEEKMDDLAAALESYQEPMTGDAKLLGTPNFKDLPATELAQLAFLRGKVYSAKGEEDKALDDYYRAFTLAYGNDVLISKLAMGAAMKDHKDDPALAQEKKGAIDHMQSIAYLFSKRFGRDTMPPDYQKYAIRPPMAKMVAEAAPPAEGEKPAEGEAPAPEGEKPAGDAKEEKKE
jgi:tetratricopeptide (TPR) repeat protein